MFQMDSQGGPESYHGRELARHRAPQLSWLWGGFAGALLFLFVSGSWAGHVSEAGEFIAPNVKYAGADLTGLSIKETARIVQARSRLLLSTPIEIDTGEGLLVLRADELGFQYDVPAVVDDLRLARHKGNAISTFLSWVSASFAGIEVDDQITFNGATARARLSGPLNSRYTRASTGFPGTCA